MANASASVLTFEGFDDGAVLLDSYGDLIDGNIVNGFPYRIEAEGTTPDVFVGFESGVDVANGMFAGAGGVGMASDGDGAFNFGFTGLQAARNVMVQLYEFTLYSKSGPLENVVIEVYDHTCAEVFRNVYTVTEEGTTISFSQGQNMFLTGWVLDVAIKGATVFDTAAIGIDDIRFGQMAVATPIPGAAVLMVTGLVGAGLTRRRRRKD